MARRYYSSVARRTTLTADVTSSATTIVVAATTGFPSSRPYTLVLDVDTVSEEVVEVTAASGTTLTVVRGVDGSTGTAHVTGAVIAHQVTARDLDEPNAHVNASAAVHGLAGSVVGTTDTQTLTNKTLTSPVLTTPVISTITNTGVVTLPTATDTLVARATADTLTNKVLQAPRESVTIVTSAATGVVNIDAGLSSTTYFTTAATGNFTLNIRSTSSQSLNTLMAVGDAIVVAVMNTNGTTAYYASGFQIDGSAVTPKYQFATAWTAGSASAIDAYVYEIIKTGSGAFTVFASQTKYA